MVGVGEGQGGVGPAGQAGAVLGFDAPHPHAERVLGGRGPVGLGVPVGAPLQRVAVLGHAVQLGLEPRAQHSGSLAELQLCKTHKAGKTLEPSHPDLLLEKLLGELTLFTPLKDILWAVTHCYLICSRCNTTRTIYYSAAL